MFNRKFKPGILVIVTDIRYECYGFGPTLTYRDAWLMSLIKQVGGVSDSVEPGEYVFNARRKGFRVQVELNPL